ncbi:unnamed protein product [Soboliphyme baturini]|uniref:UAS domain-containing protein n=1 Tax=Soboliphyme baturini TaxID=241478 RepID=A0A183IF26_9BILA|nr:unnamed protein product [Soboliphyme baturini]
MGIDDLPRKPLLIYVHSDKSISAHLFCTQVLCDPAMVDFINQNFVMWPWDVTTRENRERLHVCFFLQ